MPKTQRMERAMSDDELKVYPLVKVQLSTIPRRDSCKYFIVAKVSVDDVDWIPVEFSDNLTEANALVEALNGDESERARYIEMALD
jgi:hypothetical protein